MPVRRGGVDGPDGGPIEFWHRHMLISSTYMDTLVENAERYVNRQTRHSGKFDHIRVPEDFKGELPDWCCWSSAFTCAHARMDVAGLPLGCNCGKAGNCTRCDHFEPRPPECCGPKRGWKSWEAK